MKNLILCLFICSSLVGFSQVEETDEVFTMVERMPQFPGGEDSLFSYLAKNTKYPKKALSKNIQGTVYVNFLVHKSGDVKNVKIVRGVHRLLDKESLRVVNAMPKWEPGVLKGKFVSVTYNLPIKFRFENEK